MKTALIFINGFTQDYRNETGMEKLQRSMDRAFRHRDNVEVYEPLVWKEDMRGVAARMKRDGVTRVMIFGYSYGGGHGAPRLVKECLRVGIEVVFVGLCDPVARPKILGLIPLPTEGIFSPPHPRSLTPFASVTIPAGAGCVEGLRQEQDLPKAHPVKWRGHKWELPKIDRSTISHNTIDDSPEWVAFVLSKMDKYIK